MVESMLPKADGKRNPSKRLIVIGVQASGASRSTTVIAGLPRGYL
jgi:hypothetical protein